MLANSFQASFLAELRNLDFDDFDIGNDRLIRVADSYSGEKIWNGMKLYTSINITNGSQAGVKCVEIRTQFAQPGLDPQNPTREIRLKHHVFAKP